VIEYKKHIILFFLLSILVSNIYALEGRPKMRRACLDRLNSTLDLFWFPPTDNCGSFTSFSLYGQEDNFSPFVYFKSYNVNTNSLQIGLPNLQNWKFYIVYNKACNGIDSLFSDTIQIDNTPPVNMDLDSVSVDLASQKTIIGWSQNGSVDVKGYLVYHITGTNAIINNTVNTSYIDNGVRDPTVSSIAYGVAAYDSCSNTSLISASHQTMFLQQAYNQCNKTVTLTWTPYIGWPIQDYIIYRKINAYNFQQIGTVVNNITSFTYNFTNFGDNLCFYIRAIRLTNATIFSSSSNVVCVNTNSITPSKNSYIAKASVQRNYIELTLIAENLTSLKKINIYKSEDNGTYSLWQTINSTGGINELIDNSVRVQTRFYQYYFTTEGPCSLIFDTSNIAKTILLNLDMINPGIQNLDWNNYSSFIKNAEKQELLLLDNPNGTRSSSWNILNTFSNNIVSKTDNSNFSAQQEQLCYCIRAIENNPSLLYPRKDTSYSNIKCATADPIVYFPNAIQINGFNTTFAPKGIFLNYEKSSFQVYNRWGELLYETNDVRKPWIGTGNNGEFVDQDVYIYRSIIIGLNGKRLIFDGTITVLK